MRSAWWYQSVTRGRWRSTKRWITWVSASEAVHHRPAGRLVAVDRADDQQLHARARRADPHGADRTPLRRTADHDLSLRGGVGGRGGSVAGGRRGGRRGPPPPPPGQGCLGGGDAFLGWV